jgi:predicted CopG family antitoxin
MKNVIIFDNDYEKILSKQTDACDDFSDILHRLLREIDD